MVESRSETNLIWGLRHFFPALAGRNGHPNQCAKASTEECANAGDLAGAHDVPASTAIGQRAARSTGAGADPGTNRRIDPSGAGTFTHVQPRDFLAQYRYGFVATGNVEGHGVLRRAVNGADDFARRNLGRQNSNAHPGSERLLQLRIPVRMAARRCHSHETGIENAHGHPSLTPHSDRFHTTSGTVEQSALNRVLSNIRQMLNAAGAEGTQIADLLLRKC